MLLWPCTSYSSCQNTHRSIPTPYASLCHFSHRSPPSSDRLAVAPVNPPNFTLKSIPSSQVIAHRACLRRFPSHLHAALLLPCLWCRRISFVPIFWHLYCKVTSHSTCGRPTPESFNNCKFASRHGLPSFSFVLLFATHIRIHFLPFYFLGPPFSYLEVSDMSLQNGSFLSANTHT